MYRTKILFNDAEAILQRDSKAASEEETRIMFRSICRRAENPSYNYSENVDILSIDLAFMFGLLTAVRSFGEMQKFHRGLVSILPNGDVLLVRCMECKKSGYQDPAKIKNKWYFSEGSIMARLLGTYFNETKYLKTYHLMVGIQVCGFVVFCFVILMSFFQFHQKVAMFKNNVLTTYMGNRLLNNIQKLVGIKSDHTLHDYRYGAIRWSGNCLGVKSQQERQAHRSIETTLIYFNREEEEKKKDAQALAALRESAFKGMFDFECGFCVCVSWKSVDVPQDEDFENLPPIPSANQSESTKSRRPIKLNHFREFEASFSPQEAFLFSTCFLSVSCADGERGEQAIRLQQENIA